MLASEIPDHVAVLRASACPYARSARLEVIDPIRLHEPRPLYPPALCFAFQELVQRNRIELLDGLILPIVGSQCFSTKTLSGILLNVLTMLRSYDLTNETDLLTGIETEAWDFEYGGVSFFILALSPFYSAENTRHCNSGDTSYLLFQPESSFRRFGISSSHPNRERISQQVRGIFRSRGQVYDDEVTLSLPKRYRYIMRTLPTDPPVLWWINQDNESNRRQEPGTAPPP